MNNFICLEKEITQIQSLLKSDTSKALDTEDFSKIKAFTIEYNGIKVNIPVDCAEFNNCISDTLTDLLTIIKNDYID